MRADGWSPLRGLRVLDLSRLLPGAYTTMLLADLGADVVKVEQTGTGDPGRALDAATFAAINRNKRSVAVDLRSAEGTAQVLRLAAGHDVVVESFRPGTLDRIGLGRDRLLAANPGLVVCSLTAFGQDGPYAGRPGHDLTALALSGFFGVPHRAGEPVDRVGLRVADMAGAMFAALSVAVAAFDARRTGRGQHLDVSLHESAASWAAPFLLPLLDRADHEQSSPLVTGDNDLFVTADGRRIALSTVEDKFWLHLRTALAPEFPELAEARWDRRADRTRDRVAVRSLLAGIVAARDLAWWCTALGPVDLPWAPVHETARDVLSDPHVRARGLVGRLPGPGAEPPGAETEAGPGTDQVRFPVLFSAGLESLRSAAPGLGEHTEELLAGPPAVD